MGSPKPVGGLSAVFKLRAWKLALAGPSVFWYFPVFYALLTSSSSVDPIGLAMLFVVMIVSASWGFLLNDLADRRSDAASGRADAIHGHGLSGRTMLALTLITAGFCWAVVFLLGGNYIFKGVLALNYLIAFLYSVPPMKLKVRGFWGFLANSLMERPLPILVFLSYMDYFRVETVLLPVLMELTWSVFKHQAADVHEDSAANVRTFAVLLGEGRSESIVNHFLNPVSVLSLLSLIALAWVSIPTLGFSLAACFTVTAAGVLAAAAIRRAGYVRRYFTPTDPPYIMALNLSYRYVLLPVMAYGVVLLSAPQLPILVLLLITLAYQGYAYVRMVRSYLKAPSPTS